MHGNNAIVPTRQVSSTSQAERLCRLNPVYQEWQILSYHPFKRHGKMILKWFKSWKRYSLELKFIESFVSSNDLQVDTNSKIWSQPLSNFVSRTTSPRVSVFNSTLFTGTAEWSSLTNHKLLRQRWKQVRDQQAEKHREVLRSPSLHGPTCSWEWNVSSQAMK